MLAWIVWLPARVLAFLVLADIVVAAFQLTSPDFFIYMLLATIIAFFVFLAEVCVGMTIWIFVPRHVLARWEANDQSNP